MSIARFQSAKLLETGLFVSLEGPFGQCPVQFTGTLTTGEFLYFRARGESIELEIFPSEADYDEGTNQIGRYTKPMVIEEVVPQRFLAPEADPEYRDLGASIMAVDTAEKIILELLGTYLQHKKQAEDHSASVEEALASLTSNG